MVRTALETIASRSLERAIGYDGEPKLCSNCKVKMPMKIQELARKHGVSSAAIRHYEKLGLFDERHVVREPNGYRTFNDEAAARLLLISGGQAAGFSLRELAAGLQQWESDRLSPAEKRAVFMEQVERIDRQIEQLQDTRAYILNKLRRL